jgi:hypothetical protein
MATVNPVTKYNYQFHGGPNGYQGNRAIVRLQNGNQSVAYVHFVPAGKPIPSDTDTPPWIRMYLPESQLATVIDMLRNETPISVYYAAGSGFLLTGDEPIGESE